jgi:glucose/mannose-6-phosphate isomerase
VIILTSPEDYYRVRARVAITRGMMAPKARIHVIEAQGRSPLAQVMGVVYLGDFTSLYLAFLNGADPAAIGSINLLKSRLAKLRRPDRS